VKKWKRGFAVETIDYDKLIQDALREVVKNSFKAILHNDHVMPGNHHFYLTFQTDRPDVLIPEYLRKQHPKEMTIVVQHQYWDLKVEDRFFEISLSFNNKRELLTIPYISLVNFMDPSVKFGLQFTPESPEKQYPSPVVDSQKPKESDKNNVVTLDAFRKK